MPPGASWRPCSAPPGGRWHEPARPRSRPCRAPLRPPAALDGSLNLARRPFVNTRPVMRVSLLLLGRSALLLLLGNVVAVLELPRRARPRSGTSSTAWSEPRSSAAADGSPSSRASLAGLDLERQNEQVAFLNQKIAERTFSWSLLFDRLAEVLPDDVRLIRLAPRQRERSEQARRRRRTREAAPQAERRVPLAIDGEAAERRGAAPSSSTICSPIPSFDESEPLPRDAATSRRHWSSSTFRSTYLPGGTPRGGGASEPPPVEERRTPGGPRRAGRGAGDREAADEEPATRSGASASGSGCRRCSSSWPTPRRSRSTGCGYAGRRRVARRRASTTQSRELDARRAGRERAGAARSSARATNEQQIAQLYDERFSTRSQRLTGITAEVKKLARKAGLEPQSICLPRGADRGFGLVKRSFIFAVKGTYLELRKFINLLELSDSFLTLEEVTLTGSAERAGAATSTSSSRPCSPRTRTAGAGRGERRRRRREVAVSPADAAEGAARRSSRSCALRRRLAVLAAGRCSAWAADDREPAPRAAASWPATRTAAAPAPAQLGGRAAPAPDAAPGDRVAGAARRRPRAAPAQLRRPGAIPGASSIRRRRRRRRSRRRRRRQAEEAEARGARRRRRPRAGRRPAAAAAEAASRSRRRSPAATWAASARPSGGSPSSPTARRSTTSERAT